MKRRPALVPPPGDTIREELDARGWTQQDLADLMQRPLAAINEIINGKRKITTKSAGELASSFGVEAQFWLNLESSYQLWLSGASKGVSDRAIQMSYAPIREMQLRGWIPSTGTVIEASKAVFDFFGVKSFKERPRLEAVFKQSADEITTAHVAWCILAMRKASAQCVQPYRASRAQELCGRLRALAAHSEEIRSVPAVLAKYGIRFVVVKHLRSTKIDGATLWLNKARSTVPVIVLSLRIGRIDNFWHTLCHELSHVINRDSFRIDVDLADTRMGEAANEVEERANAEAASMLIPPGEIESFILRKRPYFSAKSIIQFANKVGIHPGIVVGQLQYRKAIKYSHSSKMLVQIRDTIIETAVSDGWIPAA
ncbi:MAG: helix-turn-helix domain-containing protein [Planctomycetes bacterium]|nr:helix-turn-helix domain-containing protein [Planctomycetota bacterium]